MKLEKASIKAVQFACKNYHYSKSVPVNPVAFSIFNDKNEWCGCILYSVGANMNIGRQYNLVNGQVIELVRVALNGKQESTSKAVSLSIRNIKKRLPLCKLLVSFADSEQGHIGTIYQATNWYYLGKIKSKQKYFYKNRWMHQKSISNYFNIKNIPVTIPRKIGSDKLKYIYPLDKTMTELCNKLKKPYPKNSVINIDSDVIIEPNEESGAVPTITHHE